MNRRLLVIIVTYNSMQWIERCLSSVISSTQAADILVVDNGSSDGTQALLKERFKNVTLIESAENLGFGKANNIGLVEAVKGNYDFAYLLNQDAWVEEDTFSRLMDLMESHPEYGILSPIQMEGNSQHMDKGFRVGVAGNTVGRSFIDDLYFNDVQDIYEVNGVMAAHWMMSISCIRKVGGFSPTFRHYGEDDNYIHRTRFHGFKVGIAPSCRAVHDRESRQETKQRRSYSCLVKTLTAMSDISGKTRWTRIFKMYIEYAYEYRMIRHFKHLFTCIFRSGIIRRNKKLSLSEGAFL